MRWPRIHGRSARARSMICMVAAGVPLVLASTSFAGVTTYTKDTRTETAPPQAPISTPNARLGLGNDEPLIARAGPVGNGPVVSQAAGDTSPVIVAAAEEEQSPPVPQPAAPRCVAAYSLSSHVRTPDNPFQLSPAISAPGAYLRFMKTEIQEDYDHGFRYFLLHRPLGEPPPDESGHMQIDAAVEIADTRFGHIIRDFDEALSWAEANLPEAVFICYVGTVDDDLRLLAERERWTEYRNRIRASLKPYLFHKNADIAFDAWALAKNGSYEQRIYKEVQKIKRAQGRTTYIEALPLRPDMHPSHSWSSGEHAFILEQFYLNQRGRAEASVRYDIILEKRAGRNFRWMPGTSPKEWDGDQRAWMRDVLEQGHIPVVGTNHAEFSGKTVDEILAMGKN